ncbi:MAG: pyridoxine 5'-phosphate synthase [Elusimicrobia bacterium]|nr:pyridoxine 5'-phosphate synthase [Elusimicrobiota bacterium]
MALLGVNIDHVATLRQNRFTPYPDPVKAAQICEKAGADGITVHLREDRRHIQESDCLKLKKTIKTKLNLEMSLADDIVAFALKLKPNDACIVPEKRRELTTEGGLDVFKYREKLSRIIPALQKNKTRVSLFIEPDIKTIELSKKLGADCVELHTGKYANLKGIKQKRELERIKKAVQFGNKIGLIVNAGHGLNYDNIKAIAKIKQIHEFNIGHSIISYSIFWGLFEAVRKMKNLVS